MARVSCIYLIWEEISISGTPNRVYLKMLITARLPPLAANIVIKEPRKERVKENKWDLM